MEGLSLSLRTLRSEFPQVPIKVFTATIEAAAPIHSEEDLLALRDLLREENQRALVKEKEETGMIQETIERITSSLIHRKLDIHIAGVHDDHLRAIIVYGFLRPSQERIFAGGHRLSAIEVRRVVENKLGLVFNTDEFQRAFSRLHKMNIIQEHTGGGFFLNLKCKINKGLLTKIKQFSHEL